MAEQGGGTGHFGWGEIKSPKESENKDGTYKGGSSNINKGK